MDTELFRYFEKKVGLYQRSGRQGDDRPGEELGCTSSEAVVGVVLRTRTKPHDRRGREDFAGYEDSVWKVWLVR